MKALRDSLHPLYRKLPGYLWVSCRNADLRKGQNFSPQTNYLVSYPKAGATWLQFLLCDILVRHFEVETDASVRLRDLTRDHDDMPTIDWTHDEGAILYENGSQPDPRRLFAYGGRRRYADVPVIFMVRDPRDIAVSYFHQVTKRSAKPMEFASLSEFIRHPLYGFARVVRFHEIWWANRSLPSAFHLIRYEDLLDDGIQTLQALLQFLELDVEDALVADAYERGSATNLRKMEAAGAVEGMQRFGQDPNAFKVRKAKSGTFREELSEDDIAFCDAMMKARFPDGYGYRTE